MLRDARAHRKIYSQISVATTLANGRPYSLAFSPDSSLLAAPGKQDEVILRTTATGQVVSRFSASEQVLSMAFSRDGRLLATGSYDGTVRLRDLAKGAARCVGLGTPGPPVTVIAFDHENPVQGWPVYRNPDS